ncbi:MAG: STAS domain-containing protein [Microthrixaceae bacterium]
MNYSDATTASAHDEVGDNSPTEADNSVLNDWQEPEVTDETSQILVSVSPGHVTVKGELDFDSAGKFRAAMAEAVSLDQPKLVLDMSEVTFMDSSGLRELAEMRSAGFEITIQNASDCVRTVLRVTRMDEVFLLSGG